MRSPLLAIASVCVIATAYVVLVHHSATTPLRNKANRILPTIAGSIPLSASPVPVEKTFANPVLSKEKIIHFSPCKLSTIKPAIVQTIFVSGNTDTIVQFSEGTKIKVDPTSFVSERTGQPIAGPVKLQVKEFYAMEDILLHDLSTSTKDGLLETNGMINIQAFAANGEACKLNKNGTVEIQFPKKNDKPGMQLFSGEKEENGNIIWKPVIIRASKTSTVSTTKMDTANLANAITSKEPVKKIIDTNLNSIPQFPGGLHGIEKNINSVKNPFPLKEQNALVIADFNVDVSGKVCYVGIMKSGNEAYAGALLRAIYEMEGWQPGIVKGKAKRMTMRMAVSFSMNNPRLMKFWSCVKSPEQKDKQVWERPYTYTTDNSQNSGEALLTNLVFKSTSLGWINCDRFYNTPAPKIDFYVAEPLEENTSLKLIFHRIKAVMNASIIDGKYVFANVPIGEPVTLIALKGDKNHLRMAIQTMKINRDVIGGFNYSSVAAEDVKTTMEQFNKLPGSVAKN